MKERYHEKVRRINCLSSDLDALYHRAAFKLGTSDSTLFVLYMLYERGGSCPLGDICRETGISKQTVNSAIRRLEQKHVIYLRQQNGRAKIVCLTPIGEEYVQHNAARLFAAECNAFAQWDEEEIDQYLHLMKKYIDTFRQQVEQL